MVVRIKPRFCASGNKVQGYSRAMAWGGHRIKNLDLDMMNCR